MAINNNLLIWSKDLLKGFNTWSTNTTVSTEADATVGGDVVLTATNSNTDGIVAVKDQLQKIAVKPGETYTVSSDFKANHQGEIYYVVKCLGADGSELVALGNYGTRTIAYNNWYRISATFTVPADVTHIYTTYRFKNTTGVYPSKLYIYHPKLELGSIATEYRPAGIESPNLIRNAHFYKGTDYWQSANPAVLSMKIADDESLQIKKEQNTAGIYVSTFTTKPIALGKTYTLTAEIMNNTTPYTNKTIFFISDSTGAGLANTSMITTIPADGTYHTYKWTFTTAMTGNTGVKIVSTSTYHDVGQALNIKSIKLEEGIYQTEWTAAPEDVAAGIDRAVIASAQKTIIDYNDTVALVANITPNLSLTQQYAPENEKFTPDWTSTNLILTASLYQNNSTSDLISDSAIQSIKWYKLSTVDGVNPVLLANSTDYTINGKTLTVKQNVMNDKSSIDFICEIVYKEPLTNKDLIAKRAITFNRVINGAVLTKAKVYLPNGNGLQNGEGQLYQENLNDEGINLLPSSNNIEQYWIGSQAIKSQIGDVIRGVSNATANPSWPRLFHTYTQNMVWNTNIQYTLSFEVRGDAARNLSYSISEPGAREPVLPPQNHALTTSWTKATKTFTPYVGPSGYKPNVIFYTGYTTGDTTSWIELRNVKLEKGSVATRWSAAPEDAPEIRPDTGFNKWSYSMYDNQNPSVIPTYSTIKGKKALQKKLVTDGATLVQGSDRDYVGHLQTAVYAPSRIDANVYFQGNGSATIYANSKPASHGGRNFVTNTNREMTSTSGSTMWDFDVAGTLTPYIGQQVTMSFDVKANTDNTHVIDYYLRGNTGAISPISPAVTINGTYKRITYTFTVPNSVSTTTEGSMCVRANTYVPGGSGNTGNVTVKNMQLELGDIPTPWSPAPEDGINLISASNLSAHGSSLVPTESYLGIPTFLNTVTTPATGNNFGMKTTLAIPYVTTGATTFTLSLKYNASAYSNTQGVSLKCYVKVKNEDGTTIMYNGNPVNLTDTANLNKWHDLVYTFTTAGKITSIDNFYFYTDYAGAGTSVQITAPKLEVGTRATPIYTAPPEDEIKMVNIPLEQGWNTIDMLWPSNVGVKTGIWNIKVGGENYFANSKFSNLYSINGAITNKHHNLYVSGWNGYNGGVTNATTVYHAHVDTDTFGEPVVEFNESDGVRNWKGLSTGVSMVSAVGAGDFTVSYDIFATSAGAKIYGGFYYYEVGGSTMAFHGGMFQIPITKIGEWHRVSSRVPLGPTVDFARGVTFYTYGHDFTGTPIMYMKRPKLEKGLTTGTIWTPKLSEVTPANPHLFSTALNKVDVSEAKNYINRTTEIVAKAELTRGSVIDTSNVTYQWYKQDASVATDQGGGTGWLKLISSSAEKGYNTDTLTIPSSEIDIFEVYKCSIKDTQVDSITYNTSFEGLVSVTNSILPIEVRVEMDGRVFLNGEGMKTVKARLFQGGKEIDMDGTVYNYKWYRWLSNATKDTSWNNGTGYKAGKTIMITSDDVDEKATFSVEVV